MRESQGISAYVISEDGEKFSDLGADEPVGERIDVDGIPPDAFAAAWEVVTTPFPCCPRSGKPFWDVG